MSNTFKLSLIALGVAGIGMGALLTASGGRAEEPAPAPEPRAEEPMRPYVYGRGGDFFIDTPSAFVRVNPSRSALQLEGPDTSVVVDGEKGRASVRAKGVSFDLRW